MSDNTQELDDDAEMAWARLLRAAQALLGAVEGELKRAGFPPLVWYDALLELRRAGEKGLRPHELEAAMLLAQYNLSRLIGRLEMAGYLERRPCPEDHRGLVVSITPEGRALLARMWPAYRVAIHRHFARHLQQDDAATLATLLGRLMPRSNVEDDDR